VLCATRCAVLRCAVRTVTIEGVRVRVANACGNNLDANFSLARWRNFDFLNREWLFRSPRDGGTAHNRLSFAHLRKKSKYRAEQEYNAEFMHTRERDAVLAFGAPHDEEKREPANFSFSRFVLLTHGSGQFEKNVEETKSR
jgi:hypothetical protein